MTALIEVDDVTVRFGADVVALDRCRLGVDQGEFVAVTGPSGSGKSTLLNVLGLLHRPTSGGYRLGGEPTAELDERGRAAKRARDIGFVFHSFHPECLTGTRDIGRCGVFPLGILASGRLVNDGRERFSEARA